MLYAVKGNKQLRIDEAEKETYLKLGYDIGKPSKNGLEIIETTVSKTVPFKKYKELEDQNIKLVAKVKELQAKIKELEKDGGK